MARCCLVMQAGSSAGQLLEHLAEVAEVEDAGGAVVLLAEEVEPLEATTMPSAMSSRKQPLAAARHRRGC